MEMERFFDDKPTDTIKEEDEKIEFKSLHEVHIGNKVFLNILETGGESTDQMTADDIDPLSSDEIKVELEIREDGLTIFKCPRCEMTSPRKDNLRRHILSVHEKIIYCCHLT